MGKAWMGLTKQEDTCDIDDDKCRVQGWQWQDGSAYSSSLNIMTGREVLNQNMMTCVAIYIVIMKRLPVFPVMGLVRLMMLFVKKVYLKILV